MASFPVKTFDACFTDLSVQSKLALVAVVVVAVVAVVAVVVWTVRRFGGTAALLGQRHLRLPCSAAVALR